jgi:hypothetical protein
LIEYGRALTLTGVVKNAPSNSVTLVNCGKIPGQITDTPPIAIANIEVLPVGKLQ